MILLKTQPALMTFHIAHRRGIFCLIVIMVIIYNRIWAKLYGTLAKIFKEYCFKSPSVKPRLLYMFF